MLLKILNKLDQLFWPAVLVISMGWLVLDFFDYVQMSDIAIAVDMISALVALAVIDIKQELNK